MAKDVRAGKTEGDGEWSGKDNEAAKGTPRLLVSHKEEQGLSLAQAWQLQKDKMEWTLWEGEITVTAPRPPETMEAMEGRNPAPLTHLQWN